MDDVILALSISIIIVAVLLLSCWQPKNTKKCSKSAANKKDKIYESYELSDWGTGVQNREDNKRYRDLADLSGYDDYNSVAQYMSIEPEVFESHNRYSRDMGRSTSGASMLSERDDPNDVIPWVGLRKPKYHSVFVQPHARQEHSDIPDQMREDTYYVVG